jgi:hypothetical protein
VRKMINTCKLGDVKNKAWSLELAHFVRVELFFIEATTELLETVEVGGVKLLKGTNKSLHIELGVNFIGTEIG